MDKKSEDPIMAVPDYTSLEVRIWATVMSSLKKRPRLVTKRPKGWL